MPRINYFLLLVFSVFYTAGKTQSCIQWTNHQAINLSEVLQVIASAPGDSVIPVDFSRGKSLTELGGWLSSEEDWWAKVCIENTSTQIQSSALLLGDWNLHEATLYHFEENKLKASIRVGFQVQVSDKTLALGYYQVAPLSLSPNTEATLLIHFRSYRHFPIRPLPVLMSEAQLISQLLLRRGFLALCIGMLILMLIFGLMLFVKMGSRVYLYYSIHLAAAIINLLAWNGGFASMLGQYLEWQVPLWQIVTLSSWIVYILFLIQMLDQSQLSKWFHRHRFVFIGLGCFFYLLSNFYYWVLGDQFRSGWVFIVQGFLFAIIVLYISFRLLKETDKASRYFLLGSIFLAAGILFNIFFELFFSSDYTSLLADPNLSIPIALVLEMSCFALGLVNKMKHQEVQATLQRLRIQKLLQQQSLQEIEPKTITLSFKEDTLASEMNPFLQKALQTIQAELGNTEFTVVDFSQKMYMSRVQLHRRLKAELGMSASETIRWVRLSYAAQLLRSTEMTITEVCYEVGFGNLSYFASCFRGLYGENPSTWRKEKNKD